LLACCLFVALGALLIPYAGIQTDEALFATPIFKNGNNNLASRIWHRDVPLMLMTYLGTLKTYAYWPLLSWFGANAWSLRLPVVLLGALTIFFFFRLTQSSGSGQVALLGAFLLATDPTFLMTQTFDWGPVAIEHFLLVTGLCALYKSASRFDTAYRDSYLFLGFFLFGLALWNKAIFSWALAGLAVAAPVVFFPELRRLFTLRRAAVAAGALLAGALPLLAYNVRTNFATLRENSAFELSAIPGKWVQVETALHGQALFGYIVAEEWAPSPKPASSLRGRAAVWIRQRLGPHHRSGFYYALGILLVGAFPWWRKRRAAWFSLLFMLVAWILMAATRDAGGSAHHVVLLWPFPILFAAIALDSLPWRRIALAAGAGLVAMNLLVVNQYISQFERFGAWGSFTDAIYPLADSLHGFEGTVWVTDWGIYDSVHLLREGRLKMRIIGGPLSAPAPDQAGRSEIHEMLFDPSALLVAHVPEREVFPNVGRHLDEHVRSTGLRKEVVRQIADSNGRPVFEVFRLVR
jgi:4-amino-4-deoxy-L-arabinose transferase-like glycosyltransferase